MHAPGIEMQGDPKRSASRRAGKSGVPLAIMPGSLGLSVPGADCSPRRPGNPKTAYGFQPFNRASSLPSKPKSTPSGP